MNAQLRRLSPPAALLVLLAACGKNDNTVADLTSSGETGATAGASGAGGTGNPVGGASEGGDSGAPAGGAITGGSSGGGASPGGGSPASGSTGGMVTGGSSSGGANPSGGGATSGGDGGDATGGGTTGGAGEPSGGTGASGGSVGGAGGLVSGGGAGAAGSGGLVAGGEGGTTVGGGGAPTGGVGGGGTGGAAGAGGSGACSRQPTRDLHCRKLGLPPLSYFCLDPFLPAASCVMYDGIDSGSSYCCPEEYPVCPDTPPADGSPCATATHCTWGSHPDPTCRVTGRCTGGSWQVTAAPTRCEEPLLPAGCEEITTTLAGEACSPSGLVCNLDSGARCGCTNCTQEMPSCNLADPDTWQCWDPPASPCPAFYPNLGSACDLDADTSCRYTCSDIAVCSAAGVWEAGGFLCPDCNAPDTPIATPSGSRPIAELAPGDLVYSVHGGRLAIVPLHDVRSKRQIHHYVVRLLLASGVTLEISATHPTADGRTFGDLAAHDRLDGVEVVTADRVPYRHSHTYDILPGSDTGTYYAGGVLIGSTLRPATSAPTIAPSSGEP